MTREAIEELKKYTSGKKNTEKVEISVLQLNRIIRALEQEPCSDITTFKEDVLDAISRIGLYKCSTNEVQAVAECLRAVEALPPVTPQPKTAQWIYDDECHEHGHCPECGYGIIDLVDGEPHNFCRRCGAKMIDVPNTNIGKMKNPTGSESEE